MADKALKLLPTLQQDMHTQIQTQFKYIFNVTVWAKKIAKYFISAIAALSDFLFSCENCIEIDWQGICDNETTKYCTSNNKLMSDWAFRYIVK